jgi:Protein of unknown function (DUF1579)
VSHERLEVLVGRWKTEGQTRGEPLRVDATDTYEWLPGGYGLLHTVDARMGDDKVEGAEIIGWNPDRGVYSTLYFGSDGPAAYEAELAEEGGALVWRMRSEHDRFEGTFDDDRSVITGHWEQLEGGEWRAWMDITLTKQPG